jgi:hypothetical protein
MEAHKLPAVKRAVLDLRKTRKGLHEVKVDEWFDADGLHDQLLHAKTGWYTYDMLDSQEWCQAIVRFKWARFTELADGTVVAPTTGNGEVETICYGRILASRYRTIRKHYPPEELRTEQEHIKVSQHRTIGRHKEFLVRRPRGCSGSSNGKIGDYYDSDNDGFGEADHDDGGKTTMWISYACFISNNHGEPGTISMNWSMSNSDNAMAFVEWKKERHEHNLSWQLY